MAQQNVESDKILQGSGGRSDWIEESLGDLIDIQHGYAFKGEFFQDEPTNQILLSPGNFMIGGGFQLNKLKYYSGPSVPDYVLSGGELLVTMTDLSKTGDTLGYPAIIPKDGRKYLHNQRLGRVRLKRSDVDEDFIYWSLRTASYRNEVLGSCTGSTVRHTSPKRIQAHRLQLPKIDEQKRIAGVLSSLDDKIELNRQMNQTLEAMARAVFLDWFVDFGPTRRKAAGLTDPAAILGGLIPNPTQSAPVAALFPDGFGANELPLGWEVREVGSLCQIAGGGTPSTTEPAFWDGGTHLWATPKDLSKQSGLFLRDTERQITNAGLAKVSSGLSPKGSVLLSSRAPIGYLAIAEEPVAVNQGFIVMQPSPEFPTAFAYFWTLENMDLIKASANGSTFQEISKKNFRPLNVNHADGKVLAAFGDVVGQMFDAIRSHEQENQTLAATRDLLLPKLMSGELRLLQGDGGA